MRILAFSDIHGAYHVVEKILARESGFDAVVIAGDLTTCGTSEEAEGALERFGAHAKPLIVVSGNMDPPLLDRTFDRLGISVNGQGRMIGEAGFFGVSASPFTPLNTPNEIAEEEIGRRAESGWKDVSAARWKIFVPHTPPRETSLDRTFLGKHVGSTAVRSFIERRCPDLVLCGHIHEARGSEMIGPTMVVNCGPAGKGAYAVVTLGVTIDIKTLG